MTRPWAICTRSLMPGTSVSRERVLMSPSTHGILISKVCPLPVGSANRVNEAGAGSVSSMFSMAASFIFWSCVVT